MNRFIGPELVHGRAVIAERGHAGGPLEIDAAGNRAVGQIDKKFQRGQIRKGDNVTTKFS